MPKNKAPESELLKKMVAGDLAARNEMIIRYRPLIERLAFKYCNNKEEWEVFVHDCVYFLLKYARDYKAERASYATFILKGACREAVRELVIARQIIHTNPGALFKFEKNITQAKARLEEAGVAPSFEAISAVTRHDVKTVAGVTALKNEIVSLQASRPGRADGSERLTWGESIGNESISPEETCVQRDWRKHLQSAIAKLSKRDRLVIKMRSGLNRKKETYTLEQIATLLAISRERVRQIEIRARNKIKENLESNIKTTVGLCE